MAEKTHVSVKQRDGALRRLDPMELFNALQDDMERFWRDTFRIGGLPLPLRRAAISSESFMPRMDVYEQHHDIVVKAELPGLKKEDVQVELDDGSLVIRGERHAEQEVKDEAYYRAERSFGSFYRRLPLPFEVQPELIQASMSEGVLEVRIPQPAEAHSEPKKIAVA